MPRAVVNAIRQVTTPLIFLTIRHPQNKFIYFLMPFAVAAGVVALDMYVFRFSLTGEDGLLRNSLSLLGILSGFFIAALAAVATFDKTDMDEEMDGRPMVIDHSSFWSSSLIRLTRRTYLCLMFGYLSFMCILLFLAGCFGLAVYEHAAAAFIVDARTILREITLFCWVFLLMNILFTSLLGIYFLSFGIHRAFPKLTRETSDAEEAD